MKVIDNDQYWSGELDFRHFGSQNIELEMSDHLGG